MKNNCSIYVDVVLYSYGKDDRDFDILKIIIPKEYLTTEELYENNPQKARYLDAIHDLALEEVNYGGETIENIHRQLWNKHKAAQGYKLHIGLDFKSVLDIFGETDIEVNYEYEEIEAGINVSEYLI